MASPASSDEGEIRDSSVEKATTSLPQFDGTSVDRPDRNRSSTSNSPSPDREYKSRDRKSRESSRSPYVDRQPRGSKRARDEEYTAERSRDTRRFKVHYEDSPHDYQRRSRVSYEDLDRGSVGASELRYDDRDRYTDKRPRTRSRSPYRPNRGHERGGGRGGQGSLDDNRHGSHANDKKRPNPYSNGEHRSRGINDQSVSKRGSSPLHADI